MSIFTTALTYFQRGGLIMWPLLLCSLAAVVLAVERYLFYKQADSGSRFSLDFCRLLAEDKLTEAGKLAVATKGETAKFAATVLAEHHSYARSTAYVESQAERVISHFEESLSYLSVIVTLSPILGLLGTITGMMSAFNNFNFRGDNPLAVTAGVAEALITTVFGLCIAVLAICLHTYFIHRLNKITMDIEDISRSLLEVLTTEQPKEE
ncbi:MAG: MotA/TolQ/ExbB proton channel family protein [Acidaminococcaceae bacterium]|nr:MotA/TolQ/ExbB proton channel family protein [Acidaminococcaceae bacterium]